MGNEFAPGPDGVTLFALSTCVWCRKTRRLLESMGISYRLIEVDLLPPSEMKEAREEALRWNPRGNFPVLVIHGSRAIIGFREDEIRRALADV